MWQLKYDFAVFNAETNPDIHWINLNNTSQILDKGVDHKLAHNENMLTVLSSRLTMDGIIWMFWWLGDTTCCLTTTKSHNQFQPNNESAVFFVRTHFNNWLINEEIWRSSSQISTNLYVQVICVQYVNNVINESNKVCP